MSIKARINVGFDRPQGLINRNIYGHFAEHLGRSIYEGIWVGEHSPIPHTRGIRNDVVAALRQLDIPVLRWPGGCFADEYHWKDGIGPREKRPRMINTHWGGVVENNHFGTHEFFDLCEQLGCAAYVCGNVGSGTVQEMMEWVEYMTSGADSPMANLRRTNGRDEPWVLSYFGVGNESWGCGGNMRAEYYADLYRRYNTFIKNYTTSKVERIAGGANSVDYHWTEVLMSAACKQMDGLSLHYYTIPSGDFRNKGSAIGFGEAEWHATLGRALRMDELIAKHRAIMDKYDPARRVGLIVDEWGTWYDVEEGTNPGFLYQQNTLRDALVAALHFHIFHAHSERVTMANIAQTVNVLQAMILTDNDRMILTPTYHVFEMYKVHQGATVLPVDVTCPEYRHDDGCVPSLHATASWDDANRIHLSVVNLSCNEEATVSLQVNGANPLILSGVILSAEEIDAHNTFDAPTNVVPKRYEILKLESREITMTLPAKSIVTLEMK